MSNDVFYEKFVRPTLFKMDPEAAHDLVHKLLANGGVLMGMKPQSYDGTDLRIDLFGSELNNPVGLAAGFDKNGKLVHVLSALGFGFAEIGSITAKPSEGNPKPRLFRLPADNALINRLGLNGEGADAVAKRLTEKPASLPLAINIAKTNDPKIAGDAAVQDIVHSFKAIRNLEFTYVAINASCPNTAEGCIQEKQFLSTIFAEIQKLNSNRLPILVKVSPDSTEQLLDDIAGISIQHGLSGYVCGNTTTTRDKLRTDKETLKEIGNGGLSGTPLFSKALALTRNLYKRKGPLQKIIGVGGISSGKQAYQMILAGATAVELYTGLIYKGPSLPKHICEELSSLLETDGCTLAEAVGAEYQRKSPMPDAV
jgi:dihydroorotate dehydrogenase